MDYNLLKVFEKVAETGSFTQAARILKQPKSRVSRAIARLEKELAVQLLRRTTRQTSLTDAGRDFHQRLTPLLRSVEFELEKVSDQQQEMSGVIRLTSSQDIGQVIVSQIIAKFVAKYPKVQFETIITNEFLNLTEENIDVAFRAGKLADSSLKQMKVLSTVFIAVCTPQYERHYGTIQLPKDLPTHRFLSFRGIEKRLVPEITSIQPLITSDSIPMILNMTLEGCGIAILPDFVCQKYLNNRDLVRLLPGWGSEIESIHALYSGSKNLSKKVRIFLDLTAEFSLAGGHSV